ncbi:hypothetical protein [Paenibacillus fonticola]|uniref:hypothetical protein n=1 Tax=Paenibacillus fonticola TaxID=379896 RepID=UPI0003765086|nr:hypothetical protein [Paenibacillus fonticola]
MTNGLILPSRALIQSEDASRIRHDYERFRCGMPGEIENYLLETYKLDVSSRYGARRIKNPFGKAAGQLSLNLNQVQGDITAGLGFVVLKTVIAEDDKGVRSMKDWAVKESKMVVSRITGKESGEQGWNVTWQGRGWHGSLASYIEFFKAALELGRGGGTVIVPSCKYHLPGPEERDFQMEEYAYTTRLLEQIWRAAGQEGPLQMEKDFSPTLAGSDKAKQQETVLNWLREVPRRIKNCLPNGSIVLGIKLMNTIFTDNFQIRAFRALLEEGEQRPDYIVYANRLYDQGRRFAGKMGAAYGGPDLSARNLRILTELRSMELRGQLAAPIPALSGTGNVHSGKMALEYALRGAASVQMHTMFQKPGSAYGMRIGTKTERALHELYFHPVTGLVPWMLHLREAKETPDHDGVLSFQAVTEWYRNKGKDYFLA